MKESVGDFLFRRLHEAGLGHMFGVPGDFVLGLMNHVLKSKVQLVGTCNELNAAYAADAYARLKGIGCVITTYTVGELSAANGIAGSYAESVPVVKITGAPARQHYSSRTLLHHTLGDYTIPLQMFAKVTSAQALIDNPNTVVEQIDKVLTVCLERSSPVYIAVCSDMVEEIIDTPEAPFKIPEMPKSDPEALDEAVLETLMVLRSSRRPIIIPGLDVIRAGLQSELRELLEASGLPFATMMLGKGILDEEHPQFIGLYCGSRSREYVKKRVEDADCTIVLGERLTDFNTGGFSSQLDPRTTVCVTQDSVRISYHVYHQVYLGDFVRLLAKRIIRRSPSELNIIPATQGCTHRRTLEFSPKPAEKLSMARLFDRISHFMQPDSIVIAETGASLFSASEVMLPKGSCFMGQTFYGSIGYTVGATLGACIAEPNKRVLLFVGDGSFQVTCQDLSTMIRYGCKPIVFLINNDGYTIERVIVDRSYNDIQPWAYHQLPKIFGASGKHCFDCHTEGELEDALLAVADNSSELTFVEVHLDRFDCNESLRAAGRQMAKNNRLLD